MGEQAGGARRQPIPGGADPAAVALARRALAPLGDQVVPGGGLGVLTTYRAVSYTHLTLPTKA